MLSFLKTKPTESPEAIELQRQLDAGEAKWKALDAKFQRMKRVAAPGMVMDRPADATEAEIERAEIFFERVRLEHYEMRQARKALMDRLAMVRAGSGEASRAYWLAQIADALSAVVEILETQFREKLNELSRVRAEAEAHGVKRDFELPGFCTFGSGGQEGVEFPLRCMRETAQNLRGDATAIERETVG